MSKKRAKKAWQRTSDVAFKKLELAKWYADDDAYLAAASTLERSAMLFREAFVQRQTSLMRAMARQVERAKARAGHD